MLRLARLDQRSTLSGASIAGRGAILVRTASFIIRAVLCLGIGAAVGLLLTARAVRIDVGLSAVRIGAWSFAPDAGRPDINPYLRARYAGTGQIPMAAGEGATLVASQDEQGNRLDRRCAYEISGDMPQARFWTLEAADATGLPIANATGRSSFTSADILRDADGRFTIAVAATPRPGNWLPVIGTGRFLLVLRLYDTAVTALGRREMRQLPVPLIVAESCA